MSSASIKSRAISASFMSALGDGTTKFGLLTPILQRVQQDETLMLALRGDYINIYYRGGNLIKITEQEGQFSGEFDLNYVDKDNLPLKNEIKELQGIKLNNSDGVKKWIDAIPTLKLAIDIKLGTGKDKHEREFQQLVARENNSSGISNETEYFIADIEYAIKDDSIKLDARFDLLAIQWLANKRKDGSNCRLALVEMKYGDGALDGKSGLKQHLETILEVFSDKNKPFLNALQDDLEKVFQQLRDLRLIRFGKGDNKNTVKFDRTANPEVIFIVANHNPRSVKFSEFLNGTVELEKINLRFFVANSAGYGMHSDCMFSLEKFKEFQKLFQK